VVVVVTDPRTPTPAGRLLELLSIIQTARWTLLDAVVTINQLYDELVKAEEAAQRERGVFEPEPSHEDYTPGGGQE
jgi:UDP-N-acetylmuramyl tripeptide synthase